jgi:ArsR family transcriptional regulator
MTMPLHQIKADFFKTLGHPMRVRVLELLSQREHSVGELMRELQVEASNLSQQLAILRRSGLVTTRKEGSSVYYSLVSPQIAELMAVARSILTSVLAEQADILSTLQSDARAARGNRLRGGSR